jgi:hypothetical protein
MCTGCLLEVQHVYRVLVGGATCVPGACWSCNMCTGCLLEAVGGCCATGLVAVMAHQEFAWLALEYSRTFSMSSCGSCCNAG